MKTEFYSVLLPKQGFQENTISNNTYVFFTKKLFCLAIRKLSGKILEK